MVLNDVGCVLLNLAASHSCDLMKADKSYYAQAVESNISTVVTTNYANWLLATCKNYLEE